jgi:hypothetical protein
LLNGDLCYANLDVDNAPGVWRDFGNNVARSAANRSWMPALGNHECEFGVDTRSGHPGEAPGGIAAQGAAGNYWNGPYGFGHYLSRFLLPDNGLTNWDGNRLRGNYGTDTADDRPQAKVITTRNAVVGSEAAGFSKNGADSVEDALCSAPSTPPTPTATRFSMSLPVNVPGRPR